MTHEEWKGWFQKFKRPLKQWQQKELDESVKLKLAISQADYTAAEQIAFEIVGGANRSEHRDIKRIDDYLD